VPTDLNRRLSEMAQRGVWRGAEAVMTSARAALDPDRGVLAPELAPRWRLPGPAVAAVAAAVVLIVAGSLYLLVWWPTSEPTVTTTLPVTTTAPATTTLPVTTTTAPTTTSTTEATTTTAPAAAPPTPNPTEPTPPGLLMNWEVVSPDSFANSRLLSVVPGGPGLVAVGGASDGYYGDAAVWVSSDGRGWTRIPDGANVFSGEGEGPEDGDQWMADITAWRDGFVAVGSDGRGQNAEYDAAVWLSADGVTWTRVPDQDAFGGPSVQWMKAVTAGGPGLVAVGEDDATYGDPRPAVWLSEDGLTWDRLDPAAIQGVADDPPGGARCTGAAAVMNDVTAGGPGLIAVGTVEGGACPYSLPAVWVSSDGSTWDQILLDSGVTGTTNLSSVRAVVVGPNGIAAVGGIGDLKAAEGGLGAGHTYGAVWMSEDGIDWRLAGVLDHGALDDTAGSRYGAYAGDARWDGDALVVLGAALTPYGTNTSYAVVWASPDLGQTWHQIAMEQVDEPPGPWSSSAWGPGDWDAGAVMSDAAPFGSQVIVVGGSGGFGSGLAWLGERQAG
jgi:hypothetical protein